MKRAWILIIVLTVAVAPSWGAGLLTPKDGTLPALQIEEHHVRVTINNGFAVTEVDQVFRNPHDRDLDALYTFPLPKNGALSELSLWIDGEEVIGEVVEKERARQIYEQERDQGNQTALAEQREYFDFDVFVSPVRAHDTVRVRLLYVQPVEVDTGIGRYVYPLEEGGVDGQLRSFWDRTTRVESAFTFEATVLSSYPVDDVRLNGRDRAVVTQDGTDTWKVWVDDDAGGASLNPDIVLYYRLAENQPARVDLLPYRDGEGPGSFMVVITPGTDLQPTVGGVDWTIVLDVSGSMSDKIAAAGEAVSQTLDALRPQDRFRLISFADAPRSVCDWRDATEENVKFGRTRLGKLGIRGGTNLYAGLKSGLEGLDEDRPNAVILLSDGGANIGPTQHRDFLDLLGEIDVRVFTFVMGQGANLPLLETLAEESGGFSMDVSNQDDLYGRLQQARVKLGHEALHGVQLKWDGVEILDFAPRHLPSAYFGQQIVAFGRYAEPGLATLTLTGRISGEELDWKTSFPLPELDRRFPEIERLRAFASIKGLKQQIDLGEDESRLRKEIVALGTEYSIVSDYTSMIVVRPERFEELGIERRNQQRVVREREARAVRMRENAQVTRVDTHQPMFGNNGSHGGFGGGASGPAFLGLIGAGLGLSAWLRRRHFPTP